MTRNARPGEGTAWLLADRAAGGFACYWYTGTGEARLVERGRAGSAADAVAWGRARTSRVRIRTAEGRSEWAGTEPRPSTFSTTWVAPSGSPSPDVTSE